MERKIRQIQPAEGPAKAFGVVLREARKAHGLSQEQLAFECGLDRSYVSLVERGVQSPTIRKLFRLAEVLKTTPSELMRRTEALLSPHGKR